jgi:hypothetical protein
MDGQMRHVTPLLVKTSKGYVNVAMVSLTVASNAQVQINTIDGATITLPSDEWHGIASLLHLNGLVLD